MTLYRKLQTLETGGPVGAGEIIWSEYVCTARSPWTRPSLGGARARYGDGGGGGGDRRSIAHVRFGCSAVVFFVFCHFFFLPPPRSPVLVGDAYRCTRRATLFSMLITGPQATNLPRP